MTQKQNWKIWRSQETENLGESITWASRIFEATDVGIEGSRHYGAALLAHSVECARAIRVCTLNGLTGPALSLARVQYEGALRGHIILHEIDLIHLNDYLTRLQRWLGTGQRRRPPPAIEVRGNKWMCHGARPKSKWHLIRCEIANLFVGSVGNLGLAHDLTHSGMTQALQMRDRDGNIGPTHSYMNQTLLLCFADRAVMFAIMTWPGTAQRYGLEIEQRVEKLSLQRKSWEPYIGNQTA